MRAFAQLITLLLGVSTAFPTGPNEEHVETTITSNTVQRFIHVLESKGSNETRALKKVFLSNRSITCNDGSQAGFYLRKSHLSKKWVIFLEGGWYCYDHQSCQNRWLRQRHYMTSSQWPETRDVGGILSPSEEDNPYWWNANHVFIPYCTSDAWSGTKTSETGIFSFMGSMVVHQVVKDIVPLGLENSTDLMLAGSSAGGIGVMINLDPLQELVHDTLKLRHITIRGVTDSGWFLDRTPFAPTIKPVVEAIRKGMHMWQGKVPRKCRLAYLQEPWRCYFGYRLYPTVKAPLFVFQWLFDEAQMDADNVGAPVTKQQWDYIHKMGDALRKSFRNVSAVFAPSCISHSVLTKRDWQNVKIDGVSIGDALHCWEQAPIRRNLRRLRNSSMLADEPHVLSRHVKRMPKLEIQINSLVNESAVPQDAMQNADAKRRKRRKHRGNRKPNVNKRNKKRNCQHIQREHKKRRNKTKQDITNNITPTEHPRSQRSVLRTQKRSNSPHCPHRRLERCSWPQCNRSCPRLHNPYTGEEMDFIELLKSFGLDMESVANALGIDMPTLNNMDHTDLLNLLTQQAN